MGDGKMHPGEAVIIPLGIGKTIENLQSGNENLVSRSQARRVIQRFERFREVLLDFEGVESIGQGFADEIFRVFKNEHPAVTLTVVRAGSAVARMIQHVSAGSS